MKVVLVLGNLLHKSNTQTELLIIQNSANSGTAIVWIAQLIRTQQDVEHMPLLHDLTLNNG